MPVFRDMAIGSSILRCARLVCFRYALVTRPGLFSSHVWAMHVLAVVCAPIFLHPIYCRYLAFCVCLAASCAVIGYFWFASCHIL